MNFRELQNKAALWKSVLLTWLTPNERKAVIVIGLLIVLGFAVKTLRGA